MYHWNHTESKNSDSRWKPWKTNQSWATPAVFLGATAFSKSQSQIPGLGSYQSRIIFISKYGTHDWFPPGPSNCDGIFEKAITIHHAGWYLTVWRLFLDQADEFDGFFFKAQVFDGFFFQLISLTAFFLPSHRVWRVFWWNPQKFDGFFGGRLKSLTGCLVELPTVWWVLLEYATVLVGGPSQKMTGFLIPKSFQDFI